MREVHGWLTRAVGALVLLSMILLVAPVSAIASDGSMPGGGFSFVPDVERKLPSKEPPDSAQQPDEESASCGWDLACHGAAVVDWFVGTAKELATEAWSAVTGWVSEAWAFVSELWAKSKLFQALVWLVALVVAVLVVIFLLPELLVAFLIGLAIQFVVAFTMYWVVHGGKGNWIDALLTALSAAAIGAWVDLLTLGAGKALVAMGIAGRMAGMAPRAVAWFRSLSDVGRGFVIWAGQMLKDGAVAGFAYVATTLLSGGELSWAGFLLSIGLGVGFSGLFRIKEIGKPLAKTRFGNKVQAFLHRLGSSKPGVWAGSKAAIVAQGFRRATWFLQRPWRAAVWPIGRALALRMNQIRYRRFSTWAQEGLVKSLKGGSITPGTAVPLWFSEISPAQAVQVFKHNSDSLFLGALHEARTVRQVRDLQAQGKAVLLHYNRRANASGADLIWVDLQAGRIIFDDVKSSAYGRRISSVNTFGKQLGLNVMFARNLVRNSALLSPAMKRQLTMALDLGDLDLRVLFGGTARPSGRLVSNLSGNLPRRYRAAKIIPFTYLDL